MQTRLHTRHWRTWRSPILLCISQLLISWGLGLALLLRQIKVPRRIFSSRTLLCHVFVAASYLSFAIFILADFKPKLPGSGKVLGTSGVEADQSQIDVCACVCACVRVRMCMCMRMWMCMRMCMCTCMLYVHVYAYAYMYVHVHVHLYVHAHMYVHAYLHAYVHAWWLDNITIITILICSLLIYKTKQTHMHTTLLFIYIYIYIYLYTITKYTNPHEHNSDINCINTKTK